MNRQRLKTGFLIISFFLFSQLLTLNFTVNAKTTKTIEVYSAFVIDGNTELDNFANKVGAGTAENPYVIQNLEIDAGNSGSSIEIRNTDRYLRIINCVVFNSGNNIGNDDAGIEIFNCQNVNLSECNTYNNQYGILIRDSVNISVQLCNTSINGQDGIRLWSTSYSIISYNIAFMNNGSGIFLLLNANSNSISYNNVTSNNYGIRVSLSEDNTVFENIMCNSTEEWIFIEGTQTNNIFDNYDDCELLIPINPIPPIVEFPPDVPMIITLASLGIIFFVVVLLSVFKLRRNSNIKKLESITPSETYQDKIKRIIELFEVSKKVKIETVANVMEMNEKELIEFIVKNRKEMKNILIDGEHIVTESQEDIGDFMDILDKQFDSWKHKEKSKDGKKKAI